MASSSAAPALVCHPRDVAFLVSEYLRVEFPRSFETFEDEAHHLLANINRPASPKPLREILSEYMAFRENLRRKSEFVTKSGRQPIIRNFLANIHGLLEQIEDEEHVQARRESAGTYSVIPRPPPHLTSSPRPPPHLTSSAPTASTTSTTSTTSYTPRPPRPPSSLSAPITVPSPQPRPAPSPMPPSLPLPAPLPGAQRTGTPRKQRKGKAPKSTSQRLQMHIESALTRALGDRTLDTQQLHTQPDLVTSLLQQLETDVIDFEMFADPTFSSSLLLPFEEFAAHSTIGDAHVTSSTSTSATTAAAAASSSTLQLPLLPDGASRAPPSPMHYSPAAAPPSPHMPSPQPPSPQHREDEHREQRPQRSPSPLEDEDEPARRDTPPQPSPSPPAASPPRLSPSTSPHPSTPTVAPASAATSQTHPSVSSAEPMQLTSGMNSGNGDESAVAATTEAVTEATAAVVEQQPAAAAAAAGDEAEVDAAKTLITICTSSLDRFPTAEDAADEMSPNPPATQPSPSPRKRKGSFSHITPMDKTKRPRKPSELSKVALPPSSVTTTTTSSTTSSTTTQAASTLNTVAKGTTTQQAQPKVNILKPRKKPKKKDEPAPVVAPPLRVPSQPVPRALDEEMEVVNMDEDSTDTFGVPSSEGTHEGIELLDMDEDDVRPPPRPQPPLPTPATTASTPTAPTLPTTTTTTTTTTPATSTTAAFHMGNPPSATPSPAAPSTPLLAPHSASPHALPPLSQPTPSASQHHPQHLSEDDLTEEDMAEIDESLLKTLNVGALLSKVHTT